MQRVLLVSRETLEPLVQGLERDGFDVSLRPPGGDLAAEDEWDVILLDLASLGEDASSRQILHDAQRTEGPATIALIAPMQIASLDPARGFDDFVLVTAEPDEVSARVRQALWKRARVDTKNILKCGDLLMDLANYTVQVAGRPVELTFKEYELLRFLAGNPDRVYNRETLLNKVWGYDFYGGARTVDVHIRRLRAKIEDRHHTFIETVRNVGYRFRVLP